MADPFDRFIRQITDDAGKKKQAAEIATAKEAVRFAQGRSSGPFKQKQLNKMGNPFSKLKWPVPQLEPGIINKQSGTFRSSWTYLMASSLDKSGGSKPYPVVQNTAPYAKFLQKGTWKMFRRPIEDSINAFVQKTLPAKIVEQFKPKETTE